MHGNYDILGCKHVIIHKVAKGCHPLYRLQFNYYKDSDIHVNTMMNFQRKEIIK